MANEARHQAAVEHEQHDQPGGDGKEGDERGIEHGGRGVGIAHDLGDAGFEAGRQAGHLRIPAQEPRMVVAEELRDRERHAGKRQQRNDG